MILLLTAHDIVSPTYALQKYCRWTNSTWMHFTGRQGNLKPMYVKVQLTSRCLFYSHQVLVATAEP